MERRRRRRGAVIAAFGGAAVAISLATSWVLHEPFSVAGIRAGAIALAFGLLYVVPRKPAAGRHASDWYVKRWRLLAVFSGAVIVALALVDATGRGDSLPLLGRVIVIGVGLVVPNGTMLLLTNGVPRDDPRRRWMLLLGAAYWIAPVILLIPSMNAA